MVKLNELPEELIRCILERVPTQNLLIDRGVCRKWKAQQELICRHRKTLILLHTLDSNVADFQSEHLIYKSVFERPFISHQIDQRTNCPVKYYRPYYERYQVKLAVFKERQIEFIVQTFPSVQTFILAHRTTYISDYILLFMDILEHYSSQLITLKLYLDYRAPFQIGPSAIPSVHINMTNSALHMLKLIHQINSFTALRHLTFEYHTPTYNQQMLQVPMSDFMFLTRLDEFYCFQHTLHSRWIDALRHYNKLEQLDKLVRFGLDGYVCPHHRSIHMTIGWNIREMDNLLDLLRKARNNGQVESWVHVKNWPKQERITHLPSNANSNVNAISSIKTTNYSALSTIGLNTRFIPGKIADLAKCLSPLAQLVHLTFMISDKRFKDFEQIPQRDKLNSVKALDIVFQNEIDSTFKLDDFLPILRTLASLLPNVGSIVVVKIGITATKPAPTSAWDCSLVCKIMTNLRELFTHKPLFIKFDTWTLLEFTREFNVIYE